MKRISILFILSITITSYAQKNSSIEQKDPATHKQEETAINLTLIGEKINGDFDGDGKIDTASLEIIKEGIFQEESWVFSVIFSNNNIPPIIFECDRDYATLVNEGDLGINKNDKISIFCPPLGGCTYSMKTYSLINGAWKVIVPLFLIPTACDTFSDEDIQNLVFAKDGELYCMKKDVETGLFTEEKVE